jgi:Flp pilus assembly protein TadD
MRRSRYRSILQSAAFATVVDDSLDSASNSDAVEAPGAPQVLRARRLRRRGEERRAMLILREACHAAEDCARLWTLYAAQCMRVGKRDDATDALTRAVWLRERDRDAARAKVTRDLLERLAQGRFPSAA